MPTFDRLLAQLLVVQCTYFGNSVATFINLSSTCIRWDWRDGGCVYYTRKKNWSIFSSINYI